MCRVYYYYMFGKALYTEYFKSEFTPAEASEIASRLRRQYSSVEIVNVK